MNIGEMAKQWEEFEGEKLTWNLAFGVAVSGLSPPGMKLDFERVHGELCSVHGNTDQGKWDVKVWSRPDSSWSQQDHGMCCPGKLQVKSNQNMNS